jgi:RNA polymerase sigma-70 factor (ECF subfamily)
MQQVDVRRLIQRAIAYDEEALTALYRHYADLIYRYIYYRVGDPTVAEDLLGDVFVRVLQDLPTYRDTGAPFEAWLYRIAHARVVDYHRRQKVRQTVPLDDRLPAAEEANPQAQISQLDESRQIWNAFNRLTGEQQQVISLRFIAGYSSAQVAQALDKTEGAVKALQHRALAALRRLVEQEL